MNKIYTAALLFNSVIAHNGTLMLDILREEHTTADDGTFKHPFDQVD